MSKNSSMKDKINVTVDTHTINDYVCVYAFVRVTENVEFGDRNIITIFQVISI